MTYFLDIRATRIQRWLARTSNLAHRRGASNLLCTRTGATAVAPRLPATATINPQAGDVDGVISLSFQVPAGGDPAAEATRLARVVIDPIQRDLPSLPFEATWAEAESYTDAVPLLLAKAAAGDYAYDAPAVTTELVMAMRCPECAQQPAGRRSGRAVADPENALPCAECRRRRTAAKAVEDQADGPSARVPRTERALHQAYGTVRIPRDFAGLARSLDPRGTQLALIYADGNRFGALIQAASAAQLDKAQLARALQAASAAALVAAVRADLGDDHAMLPAIPHLVGGDDLLLSVPAEVGWRVAVTFIRTFGVELAALIPAEVAARLGGLPSYSVGLLFHHYSEPFPYVFSRGDRLLDQAKHEHQGAVAAIAFADLTFDGEDVRSDWSTAGIVRTLTELDRDEASLGAVASTLPTAQRYSLYDLARVRERPGGPPRAAADLGRKIVERDHHPLLQLLYLNGVALRGDRELTPEEAGRVREILSLLRWWRP